MILEIFSKLNDSMILCAQDTNISLRLFFIKEETSYRVLFGPAAVCIHWGTWTIPSCPWLGHLAAGKLHSIPAALPGSAVQTIISTTPVPCTCTSTTQGMFCLLLGTLPLQVSWHGSGSFLNLKRAATDHE